MQANHLAAVACGLAATLLLATSALGQDGKAAFAMRSQTMKEIGRAYYGGIGRVLKGRAEYGPATVTAAESLPPLVARIPTLFPPGSDLPDSKMKPEIMSAPDKVAQLVAGVQATLPTLITEVKTGDKARIATAYAATEKACNACHDLYRKE